MKRNVPTKLRAANDAGKADPWALPPNRRWTKADIARAEHQLRMLREIGKAGLSTAEKMSQQAEDEFKADLPVAEGDIGDFAEAFERLAASVRRSILLETKFAGRLEAEKRQAARRRPRLVRSRDV